MQEFVSNVNNYISRERIPSCAVVNIDETNIDFDMPSNKTLERVGSRSVTVRGVNSSDRCTVLLGVTLSGEKLPPFIVFKGSPNGRIIREVTSQAQQNGYPPNIVMTVQTNCWMNVNLMQDCITKFGFHSQDSANQTNCF